MSYIKYLENLGIKVTKKVDDSDVVKLANNLAWRLISVFDNVDINYLELVKKIIDIPMYYAEIPEGLSQANYIYKNSTMYFSNNINLDEMNEFIFHECIHIIQEYKNKKNQIVKMGLCSINDITVTGMALNEAAIQYIISKVLKNKKRDMNIYGINIKTFTKYYPIIENLVEQLAYLIGEQELVESTLKSSSDFKFACIDKFGEIGFSKIQSNFDEILKIKEKIVEIQKSDVEDKESEIERKIQNIQNKYMETQNIIYTNYFNDFFRRIETIGEVELFKEKLNNYKNLIGSTEKENSFNEYYEDMEIKAREKVEKIKQNTALVVDNRFTNFIRKIKKLFMFRTNEYGK